MNIYSYAHPFKTDVFFSYATADDRIGADFLKSIDIRNHIRSLLNSRIKHPMSVSCWIDRDDVKNGGSIKRQILDGLSSTAILVIGLSKNYVKSEWCRQELLSFIKRNTWPNVTLQIEQRMVIVALDETTPKDLSNVMPTLREYYHDFDDIRVEPGFLLMGDGSIQAFKLESGEKNSEDHSCSEVLDRIAEDTFRKLEKLRKMSPTVMLGWLPESESERRIACLAKLERHGLRGITVTSGAKETLTYELDEHLPSCHAFLEIERTRKTPTTSSVTTYTETQTNALDRHVDSQIVLNKVFPFVRWLRMIGDESQLPDSKNSLDWKVHESELYAGLAELVRSLHYWTRLDRPGQIDAIIIANTYDHEHARKLLPVLERANQLRREKGKHPLSVSWHEEEPPPGETAVWERALLCPISISKSVCMFKLPCRKPINLYSTPDSREINSQLNTWEAILPSLQALSKEIILLNIRFTPPAQTDAILNRPRAVEDVDYDPDNIEPLATIIAAI